MLLGALLQCRHDPRQIAIIDAALGVAGVVARDGVLERLLTGSVGFGLDIVAVLKDLPANLKIEAWVKQKTR